MPIYKPSMRDEAIKFINECFDKKKWIKADTIPEKKTIKQNDYIWLVFTFIGDETGNDKNDIYAYYLDKFPTLKTIYKNKIETVIRISMSQFSKEQMIIFIDKVVIDARQEGYDVPDPEDKKALDMYNYYRKKGLI